MNIGDKVRLVHGKEEGVVYRFLPGNVVEIEIEDGFRIPVLKNEVVLISPLENERLRRQEAPVHRAVPSRSSASVAAPFAQKGLYLVFLPINDRMLSVHLINNSDWQLPYTAYQESGGGQSGLAAGMLAPRTTQKLTEVQMQDFEQWPVFEVRALYFKEGKSVPPPPFHKRLKCRMQSFYKRKRNAPVLNKEAYVYQLDEEGSMEETAPAALRSISATELREKMLSSESEQSRAMPAEKVSPVVDLHLEKLNPSPSLKTNADRLSLQLDVFEKQLEKAIAAGQDDITFIHGAGNGVLRNELHRRLSGHQHVQFFKDAQKEKFGYGATYVKIK